MRWDGAADTGRAKLGLTFIWSPLTVLSSFLSRVSPLTQLSSLTTPQPGSGPFSPCHRMYSSHNTISCSEQPFSVTQALLNSFDWTDVQVSAKTQEYWRLFVCKGFLFVYDLFISHLIPQRESWFPPTRVSANSSAIIRLAHLDVKYI